MMLTHPEEELLAGHLEGALDAPEEALVAEHLATCAECTERLVEIRALLALIPEMVDDLMPPASVKTGLMAAIERERRADADPATVEPIKPASRWNFAWWPSMAIAAALVVAAFLGAVAWSVVAPAADSNEGLLLALTGTGKGTVLPMDGTNEAPNVRAALLAPAGVDRVYVVASNVPQPPAGQAYHLYLFEDGKPQPAIVLQPDAMGRVNAVLDAPLSRFDAMEVDIQPVGTSAPGGTAVLKSKLPG